MRKIFKTFALGLLGITLLSIFMALPTQFLWNNCLSPAIDGVNPLGFWQALGINVLSSIFFKPSNSKTIE